MLHEDLLLIRRLAGYHAGHWTIRDGDIYNDLGERIVRCFSSPRAQYLVAMHNTWLELYNDWLMARRGLRDRQNLDTIAKKERKRK